MSHNIPNCFHHMSVCTKKLSTNHTQHTPLTLYHSLSRDTNLTFSLLDKSLIIKKPNFLFNTFALENFVFSFGQSFPPVNFNFLFTFFAAHKIHGMDDRGYQVICLK